MVEYHQILFSHPFSRLLYVHTHFPQRENCQHFREENIGENELVSSDSFNALDVEYIDDSAVDITTQQPTTASSDNNSDSIEPPLAEQEVDTGGRDVDEVEFIEVSEDTLDLKEASLVSCETLDQVFD